MRVAFISLIMLFHLHINIFGFLIVFIILYQYLLACRFQLFPASPSDNGKMPKPWEFHQKKLQYFDGYVNDFKGVEPIDSVMQYDAKQLI